MPLQGLHALHFVHEQVQKFSQQANDVQNSTGVMMAVRLLMFVDHVACRGTWAATKARGRPSGQRCHKAGGGRLRVGDVGEWDPNPKLMWLPGAQAAKTTVTTPTTPIAGDLCILGSVESRVENSGLHAACTGSLLCTCSEALNSV